MAKKKLLASVALAAGLLGGGVAGLILGVPGVSSAQTTTAPDDGAQAPERAPRGDGGRENCPDKEGGTEGEAPSGSSANAGFGRGAGRRV